MQDFLNCFISIVKFWSILITNVYCQVLGRFNTVVDLLIFQLQLPAITMFVLWNSNPVTAKPKKTKTYDRIRSDPSTHTRFVPNGCLSRHYERVWKLRNSPPWTMWKVVTEVGWDTLLMEVCFFIALHGRLGHHTRTYVPVMLHFCQRIP